MIKNKFLLMCLCLVFSIQVNGFAELDTEVSYAVKKTFEDAYGYPWDEASKEVRERYFKKYNKDVSAQLKEEAIENRLRAAKKRQISKELALQKKSTAQRKRLSEKQVLYEKKLDDERKRDLQKKLAEQKKKMNEQKNKN